jgi:hypothetical protein
VEQRPSPVDEEVIAMMLGFAAGLLLVILTVWLARYGRRTPKRWHKPSLQMIDGSAFRNLLSKEDDAFLKSSLPARYYWIAKRARTRAIQQYLLWIANGCASVQSLVRSDARESLETQARARSLSTLALRLRLASLGLWGTLWLQRLFPQFDLMPNSLIARYDKLAGGVSTYLVVRSGHRRTNVGNAL